MRLMLTHVGGGRFVPSTDADRALAVEKLPTGIPMFHEIERRRSRKQDRWLFGFVRAVWRTTRAQDRWENPGHLRAWLFCKVGYSQSMRYEVPMGAGVDEIEKMKVFVLALIDGFVKRGEYYFVFVESGSISVHIPRSWSHDELGHEGATKVTRLVQEVVLDELCPGMTVAEILEGAQDDV